MIIMDDVVVEYPKFTLNVSLQLQPGQISGIVGENGAGKSTTFKTILGLVENSKGSVQVFGKDNRKINRKDRENIGVTLSESFFSSMFTVNDIKKVQKACYPAFQEAFFDDLCQRLDVPVDMKVKEFSTGMKAKIKVISAITHSADLLLLDEPTAGLDVGARTQILELLQEYLDEDENRSIFISSHILTDLQTLCDDLYFIHKGKIILHEDTDVLLDYYGILSVTEKEYQQLDKDYFIRVHREAFGYKILTKERNYYQDNYPNIVVEKPTIDEITLLMMGDEAG